MTGTLLNDRLNDEDASPRAVSDRFSWRRVAMVAEYYRVFTDRQMLIYTAVSLLFSVLLLLPFPSVIRVAIFTCGWAAIPLMFYVAPVVFASKGDARPVDRMLPALASERYVYLILYLFVAVPASLYLLPLFVEWLMLSIPSLMDGGELEHLLRLQLDNPWLVRLLNLTSAVAIVLTCLYVTERARTSRVVKGVLAMLAAQFALGIIGAIYGMAEVFKKGYEDGIACTPGDTPPVIAPPDVEKMVQEMSQSPYIAGAAIVVSIWMIVMFVLCYRNMKNRNL